LPQSTAQERYHWQHQIYVLQRELLEYQLSAHLNEIKLSMGGELTYEYLYEPDEEIAAIGRRLNRLRIQRRIYDYVVQAVTWRRDQLRYLGLGERQRERKNSWLS
jgi:hypothetical protein